MNPHIGNITTWNKMITHESKPERNNTNQIKAAIAAQSKHNNPKPVISNGTKSTKDNTHQSKSETSERNN